MTIAPRATCDYCEHPKREQLFARKDKTTGLPVWTCQAHYSLTNKIDLPRRVEPNIIAEQPTLF
jgi:hypothetical protein